MNKITVEKYSKHSRADWRQSEGARRDIGPSGLAVKVADILGQVFQGIYHVDDQVLARRINWISPQNT